MQNKQEQLRLSLISSRIIPVFQLPRDRFLHELKRFGFKLEPNLLEFFLKRLNVDLSLTNDGIPYLEVINAFKQKSDPTRKRINADNHLYSFLLFIIEFIFVFE